MSNNLVLYRKYRPKNFSEVVGQDHVTRTLGNALKLDKVAHAYLFTGPRGSGKTTVARLLAKAVNCLERRDFEPCNKCEPCGEINTGRSLDMIEIDAASNRGIDEIRELREGIKFSPSRLKYKVFIIDEVHQLTKEAFNALLKTLEEPPAHAIFILATTEIHKVPQTIISRCQRFDFHKVMLEKIVSRLQWIADQEKVQIQKEALELVAANSEGAMRDAESLLDQVMSLEDKDITLEEVRDILGVVDVKMISEIVDCLAKADRASVLEKINKISEEGHDMAQFAKTLVSYLRKTMVLKTDANLAPLVAPELTKEQVSVMVEQAGKFSPEQIVRILRLFIQAEFEVKNSDFPQLPLELAVVEAIGE